MVWCKNLEENLEGICCAKAIPKTIKIQLKGQNSTQGQSYQPEHQPNLINQVQVQSWQPEYQNIWWNKNMEQLPWHTHFMHLMQPLFSKEGNQIICKKFAYINNLYLVEKSGNSLHV